MVNRFKAKSKAKDISNNADITNMECKESLHFSEEAGQ